MSEVPQINEIEPENPERREFFGTCRNAMLATAGVVLGLSGCATLGSARKKPEWADAPEVFEKDGRVYIVAKNKGINVRTARVISNLKARKIWDKYRSENQSVAFTLLERTYFDEHDDNGNVVSHVMFTCKKGK